MQDDWRTISRAMKRESPVFVVGVPRSGTSVLRRTLANLAAFRTSGADSPETFVFLRPKWILHLLEPRGVRLFRYLQRDEAAARRLLELVGGRMPRPGAFERLLLRMQGAPAFATKGLSHLVRLYFHAAREVRGDRRILEKTPAHVLCIPEIRWTFPRARVVHCVRHPVDVLASFRKRLARERASGVPEERARRLDVGVESFAARYERAASPAAALRDAGEAASDGSACVVRYEDLTADPERTLERVCRTIGEPMDAAALGEPEERRHADGAPRPDGRIVANPRSFEKWVAAGEVEALERRLHPLMLRLGYAPVARP